MDPEQLLPDALLERIRGRAAGYDERNEFFFEDLEELAAAGYLKAFVPVSDGELGLGVVGQGGSETGRARGSPRGAHSSA